VSLVVYDVTGARIKTLANGPMAAGLHSRRWEGTDERGNRVSTGVYFYRLEMPGFADTKKMVLLK
jgi:flagellar hook assembly protein FlgD